MSKRTPHDEYKYDEELRRVADIKSEVIVDMRQYQHALLENQQRLLSSLIQESDLLANALEALRVYREQALNATNWALQQLDNHDAYCVPNCTKHKWDSTRGWTRMEERR